MHRLLHVGDLRPAHASATQTTAFDLPDIQGLILRGYKMPYVRHFLLTVRTPSAARAMLGRTVSGDEAEAPQLTTAENWHVGFESGPHDDPNGKPRFKDDYCLNVGITWNGLLALEVREREPALSFESFNAFVAGAAARAASVGDTGPSAPNHWTGKFGSGEDHVLITLHAMSPDALETYTDQLTSLFNEREAFNEIWRHDGVALTEIVNGTPTFTSKVHFGYTDGVSRVTIRGGPELAPPDSQEPCEPWLFVLLDGAENYDVPMPRELGLNGSFAVFKIAETDVVAFEAFLQSKKDVIDPELLAAKMVGRWRNGVPLALSPETDSPAGPISMNDFGYVAADGSGDPRGLRCPVGAHIRRVNPRGQPVSGQGRNGGSNNTHRLIRRGMPYGPLYDSSQPPDGIERGLLGYFVNSNIENQYEFVLSQWVNESEYAGAVRLDPKSKDPIIGTQDPTESVFVIPQANGAPPIKVTGLSTFITTRGAAYCFLPSVTALKFIAAL
jgi:Dyp-type peroxidase family